MAPVPSHRHSLSAGNLPRRRSQPRRRSSRSDESLLDFNSSQDSLSSQLLHPLREQAERVGHEVELFAEKLDSWDNLRRDAAAGARREAAFGFISECKNIAEDTVKRLRRRHDGELRAAYRAQVDHRIDSLPTHSKMDTSPRHSTTVADLEEWQMELNTWELAEELFHFQAPHQNKQTQAHTLMKMVDRHGAGRERGGHIFSEFLNNSTKAQEKYIVLKWLEKTADITGEDLAIIEESLEEKSRRGAGLWAQPWLYTREKIKGEKRIRLWDVPIGSDVPDIANSDRTGSLVSQLDPDAANRQQRGLEKADEELDLALSACCWQMLRRGASINTIVEWCLDRSQFWRSLSMGVCSTDAWSAERQAQRVFLWRRMCLIAAQHGSNNAYDQSILSVCAGTLPNPEPATFDWTDKLYAKYNNLLWREYENFVHSRHNQLLPGIPLQSPAASDECWDFENDWHIARWQYQFSLLRISALRHENVQPFRVIQGYLIGSNVNGLLLQQGLKLGELQGQANSLTDLILDFGESMHAKAEADANVLTHNFNALRVLAHMLLILQDLGIDNPHDPGYLVAENVLVKYIEFLRLAGKISLIPRYISRLSKSRGEATMARILPHITDVSERIEQVRLMASFGTDAKRVILLSFKMAMQYYTSQSVGHTKAAPESAILETTDEVTWPGHRVIEGFFEIPPASDEELMLVQLMGWFLAVPEWWSVTFLTLTELCRTFLLHGRLNAAFQLTSGFPYTEISALKTPHELASTALDVFQDGQGDGDVEMNEDEGTQSAILRRVLQSEGRTYAEMCQLLAAMAALDRWTAAERDLVSGDLDVSKGLSRRMLDDVTAAMDPVLKGILLHCSFEDRIPSLSSDLATIRQRYLPDLVLGYHSALHCAGHVLSRTYLLLALEVANAVADNAELARCFTATGRMHEVVQALALSSKAILQLNEQRLGNKGTKEKKRAKTGQTLGIWDIVE